MTVWETSVNDCYIVYNILYSHMDTIMFFIFLSYYMHSIIMLTMHLFVTRCMRIVRSCMCYCKYTANILAICITVSTFKTHVNQCSAIYMYI